MVERMPKGKVMIYYIHYENNKNYREAVHELLMIELTNLYIDSTNEITIKKGKYGKPYAVVSRIIEYNISYTTGAGVIALCENRPIGVDIECVGEIHQEILERCYHEKERCYILNGKEKNKMTRRFYEIWTKKEAYVKYLGVGINKNFATLNVLDESIANKFQTVCIENCILTVYTEGNYSITLKKTEM